MKPLVEITATAIRVLSREIGSADTARFLNQFTMGRGDYTADRDDIVGEPTVDELIEELNRRRGAEKPGGKSPGKKKRTRDR
jgi:hypothetical protein